ncbi:TetR/AcrR family transcriptional regulator [Paenibacillus xanthanilyticus]|uniref:TetR/AcrR family transcriptional regulator n=1 Tax=Paenibacillus xanthanilyticus TaxID=1783531 RepID=A0ABV8K696_9BACL
MNPAKGTDRRIRRTRAMIFEAFLTLLNRKSYAEISIVDIAEQADINRSTVYAHFVDKDDLMRQFVADNLDALKIRIEAGACAPPSSPAFRESDPIFEALFDHTFERDAFYRLMLANDPSGEFRARLHAVIRDGFFRRLSKLGLDQKLQVPLDLLLDYVSCSTAGILHKWLSDNTVYSPRHMALQLTRLALLGVYRSMGIDDAESTA